MGHSPLDLGCHLHQYPYFPFALSYVLLSPVFYVPSAFLSALVACHMLTRRILTLGWADVAYTFARSR